MEQLKLFADNLPQKAYSCDTFADNKVRRLQHAIEKKYIQPNNFNSYNWLVFDIDYALTIETITEDIGLPAPTFFVQNPKNRHAHVFYLLEIPVHNNTGSSYKALKLCSAVQRGMLVKLDADVGYNNLLAKNALHNAWNVIYTPPVAYSLTELAEYVDLNTEVNLDYGLGRNCTLFDQTRKWAYRAIRQGWPALEQWLMAVEQRVLMYNKQFETPLDYNECKHIAKSIANYTHSRFSPEQFSQWQAEQGAKGGKAKGKAYEDKRSQALALHTKGLSNKDIAKQLGIHRNSVRNYLMHK